MKALICVALGVAVVSGCASPPVVSVTPPVVSVKKPGDEELTCPQLKREYEEAFEVEAKARKERVVTVTKVAATSLFWPGLLGTYADTEEAIIAAKDRQKRLERLADDKKCKL